MAFTVTEDTLRTHFKKYGKIVNVKVPQRPDGKSKGIAFIEFADSKTALKACNGENGKDLEQRALKINFSKGG